MRSRDFGSSTEFKSESFSDFEFRGEVNCSMAALRARFKGGLMTTGGTSPLKKVPSLLPSKSDRTLLSTGGDGVEDGRVVESAKSSSEAGEGEGKAGDVTARMAEGRLMMWVTLTGGESEVRASSCGVR